jgi:hypothetical protein
MRCELCQGSGNGSRRIEAVQVAPNRWTSMSLMGPCPDCNGAGIVSCCEGTERDAGVAGVDAPAKGATTCEPRR